MESSNNSRLDVEMTARGLARSRERAQQLIKNGFVTADGAVVKKPSFPVTGNTVIEVTGSDCEYVSRGGLKLEKALEVFACDPKGLVCADIGASTGGFTDVLLKNGAAHVYAVDVGTMQLADELRNDSRVTVMENTNARTLTREMLGERPQLAVMDVSFISVKLILPALTGLVGKDGRIISLIKPQFEAGRRNIGKNGIVSDKKVHAEVLKGVRDFVEQLGFHVKRLTTSPIKGGDGNREFLFDISADGQSITDADISEEINGKK